MVDFLHLIAGQVQAPGTSIGCLEAAMQIFLVLWLGCRTRGGLPRGLLQLGGVQVVQCTPKSTCLCAAAFLNGVQAKGQHEMMVRVTLAREPGKKRVHILAGPDGKKPGFHNRL